jgi:UDP-N-acetylglucosamine 1-carboxyvinyltransferase
VDCIVINGGNPLKGEVSVSGSKNAALPIMVATLLADGCHKISGIPDLMDINTLAKLLTHLGAEIQFNENMEVKTHNISVFDAPYELVRTMRASFLVIGPLIARLGKARVSLPGGCAIGVRPVDIHIKGLEAMGVKIDIDQGYVTASCDELKGAHIILDMPTVGGTENIIMTACLAKGTTVIENAAREPEIIDLVEALKTMGAKITGEGTGIITIEGVSKLNPLNYTVIPDRIEAGTFMVAAGISKGDIYIKNCPVKYMGATIDKLRETGIVIEEENGLVHVSSSGKINSVEITTNPYPGFPTDMQAQMMAILSIADGTSVIRETIFENRFIHVAELDRLGASIKVEHDTAIINGVDKLKGATVMATDLRASASLILSGLIAEGKTTVLRVYHLDRGYDCLEEKLKLLGADMYRTKEDDI